MRPGLILMGAGIALVAAGIWAKLGWELAAMVVGALLVAIAALALPGEESR